MTNKCRQNIHLQEQHQEMNINTMLQQELIHIYIYIYLERTSTTWSIIIGPHLSKIQIQSPLANSDDPAWARTNARPDLDPYCLRMSEVACHCVVASNCCPLNF